MYFAKVPFNPSWIFFFWSKISLGTSIPIDLAATSNLSKADKAPSLILTIS